MSAADGPVAVGSGIAVALEWNEHLIDYSWTR
jgi:hypothetical protein